MKSIRRLACLLMGGCAICQVAHAFTTKTGVWNIRGTYLEGEKVTVVLEYSESTFKRDIGDVLLAGRGRKVSARTAYASVELDAVNKNVAAIQRAECILQDAQGRRLRPAAAGRSQGVSFIDLAGSRCVCCVGGVVQDAPVMEGSFIDGWRLDKGGAVMLKEGGLWAVDSSMTNWMRLGVAPNATAGSVTAGDNGAVIVCAREGLSLVVTSYDPTAATVIMHELSTGTEMHRVEVPRAASVLGICTFAGETNLVWASAPDQIGLVSLTGEAKGVVEGPAFVNARALAAERSAFATDVGFVVVSLVESQKQTAGIRIWKLTAQGDVAAWTVPVRLVRPDATTPDVAAAVEAVNAGRPE